MKHFQVDEQQTGQRLDVFLVLQLEQSRASIQKLIKAGLILINGKTGKANTRLETGDEIRVEEREAKDVREEKKKNIPVLDILFENEDLLVINKPAGLLVHAVNASQTQPTVVDALLERYPQMVAVGEDPMRPGIVHRLDKDVSGLMVIAKTQQAFENLKIQFQTRTVFKEYLALVYGPLVKDQDIITLKIARSKAKGRMVARPTSQEGKEAKTEYEIITRFKNHTFIRVILHTGRTNQIRVHFDAINHPLVGDELYKKSHMKSIRPIKMDRIFLHAHKLGIHLMDGTQRTFESPLPNDLTDLLLSLTPLS